MNRLNTGCSTLPCQYFCKRRSRPWMFHIDVNKPPPLNYVLQSSTVFSGGLSWNWIKISPKRTWLYCEFTKCVAAKIHQRKLHKYQGDIITHLYWVLKSRNNTLNECSSFEISHFPFHTNGSSFSKYPIISLNAGLKKLT